MIGEYASAGWSRAVNNVSDFVFLQNIHITRSTIISDEYTPVPLWMVVNYIQISIMSTISHYIVVIIVVFRMSFRILR